jgi:hypothetical protein
VSDSKSGKNKLLSLLPYLNEKQRRIAAAVEARSLGYGGVSEVAKVTGLSRTTLHRAIEELKDPKARREMMLERVRVSGGGRKKILAQHPSLLRKLKSLVEPATRGDPMSPLLWTSKSTRHLSEVLSKKGRPVGPQVVARALQEMNYSLQANSKTLEEGSNRPNRDSQFHYLNKCVSRSLNKGDPVISVDTKKKELIGHYHNKGREWRPQGEPEKVLVHDFIDPDVPKAIPYGVYDVGKNAGWVNVGCDHDTATFAMESIRRWWRAMGEPVYPEAQKLLICADSGGSNGYRIRLWKVELQKFGDETGLEVAVCHLPPGTSKWNKIEHRLFSHISMNWRGRPLVSHEVVVKLIGKTKTKTGLKVKAKLDKRKYPTKVKVSDEEMEKLNIEYHLDSPNPEWNYTIRPRNQKPKK